MIAHDFFRLPLAEVMRRHKRSPIFRHVLFSVGELHDPLEPEVPFNMQGLLWEVEQEWRFRRDAVPEYIKLFVGRAARERSLSRLAEEYCLPPTERFKRIETTVKMAQYSTHDPETWPSPFFCAIVLPAEFSAVGVPITWCGNRSSAPTDPAIRPWFFDKRSKVFHGEEAVKLCQKGSGEMLMLETNGSSPSLPKRIAKYMERTEPAIAGQHGHTAALLAARHLVWDWGLSQAEALPYFKVYNERCEPPWSEAELERKLKQALDYPSHKTTRGHLLGEEYSPPAEPGGEEPPLKREPPPRPAFEPGKLARLAGQLEETIDAAYLEARSKFTCWNRSPAGFLHKLYRPGENIIVFDVFESQGREVWEHPGLGGNLGNLNHFKSGCENGVWFLCQPVTGQYVEAERLRSRSNPAGRSRRCEECVTAWRYALLESDHADPNLWLKVLVQWPLPIAAIYLSGKRSIHVLLQIDAGSKKEWDAIIRKQLEPKMVPFGTCPGSLTAVRLTRLPGCMREETGKIQQLLYLDDEPDCTPICKTPVRNSPTTYEVSEDVY